MTPHPRLGARVRPSRRAVAGVAVTLAMMAIAALATLTSADAQEPVLISEVPRAALAGPIPRSGLGVVATFDDAEPAAVIATLADAGCGAQTIALHDGEWRVFVAGAPPVVNQAFPANVPTGSAVWVQCTPVVPLVDAANASYEVEGRSIALVGGESDLEIVPGAATRLVTSLSTHQAFADLDGIAGVEAAVVLVQNPGGSGTFSYLAVARVPAGTPVPAVADGGVPETASGGNIAAVLIGDRVQIRFVSVEDGVIRIDYLTHAPGQALAEPPRSAETRRFSLVGDRLEEQLPSQ